MFQIKLSAENRNQLKHEIKCRRCGIVFAHGYKGVGYKCCMGEVKDLIVKEINIARSEGEKTSRLTSLYNKLPKCQL